MILSKSDFTVSNRDITVSVVLVCYNQENYIGKALDSVLMQKTDFNYEIIVGDDASTDSTAEIVEAYCRKHPDKFRFVRREKNLGATRNAYELMLMCQGDFIAYIEGDDFWTDELKLQKQTDFLIAHDDYFGCTCDFSIVNSSGDEMKGYRLEWVKQKKRFRFEDFDCWHLPGQSSTYLRRNIYKKPQFDYSVMYKTDRTIGDRISAMVYLMHGDYYCFGEKMSAYRILDNCATVDVYSDPISALQTDLDIYRSLCDFAERMGRKLKSDFAARRIYYSCLFRRLSSDDNRLKEISEMALSITRNRARTVLLFPFYVLSKLAFKLKTIKYSNRI